MLSLSQRMTIDLIYKLNYITTAAVETVKLFIKWDFIVELIVNFGVWGSCVLQFDAPFLSFLLDFDIKQQLLYWTKEQRQYS